jgi:hypothetical protein
MVAAFLVLRLRSVLGRRTGFERPPRDATTPPYDPRAKRAAAEGDIPELPPPPPRPAPPAMWCRIPGLRWARPWSASRASTDLRAEWLPRRRRGRLPHGGGRLRPRRPGDPAGAAGDETYGGFEGAITAREQAGETQRSEVRAMQEAGVEAADLRGTVADVTVRFVSDQINLTTAADGSVSAGAEAVTELTDIWTFQRDLRSGDPTWRLVATRSA